MRDIPAHVLANRGALSINQALCAYLVDDKAGPRMTYQQAADALGYNARQQVGVHLKAARAEADDFGWLPWYLDRFSDPTGPQHAET